ncbi:MAG: hypothetical protein D6801_06770 [Alphaproteobacteria bacterium]|nr:MAG: hypothetical protein D6801_06770 [Alphaproteobacteria bacterium]
MGVTVVDSKTTQQVLIASDETYVLAGTWKVDGIAANILATGINVVAQGKIFATDTVGLGIHSVTEAFDVLVSSSAEVWATYAAVQFSNQGGNLVNFGQLVSDATGDNTSFRAAVYGPGQTVIENHGVIANTHWRENSLSVYAIYLDNGSDNTVVNSGVISRDVFPGSGNDTFTNLGGTVTGTIKGGGGDDLYQIDGPGVTIFEYGNQGTDTVETGQSYTLGANVENLTLTGAADARGTTPLTVARART